MRLYGGRDQWRWPEDRRQLLLLASVLKRFVYPGQRLFRGVVLVLAHVPVPVTALGARISVHLGRGVRGEAQTPARPGDLVLGPRRVLGHYGPGAVGPYPQQSRV